MSFILMSLCAIDTLVQILEEFVHALDLLVSLFPDLLQHFGLILVVIMMISIVILRAIVNFTEIYIDIRAILYICIPISISIHVYVYVRIQTNSTDILTFYLFPYVFGPTTKVCVIFSIDLPQLHLIFTNIHVQAHRPDFLV